MKAVLKAERGSDWHGTASDYHAHRRAGGRPRSLRLSLARPPASFVEPLPGTERPRRPWGVRSLVIDRSPRDASGHWHRCVYPDWRSMGRGAVPRAARKVSRCRCVGKSVHTGQGSADPRCAAGARSYGFEEPPASPWRGRDVHDRRQVRRSTSAKLILGTEKGGLNGTSRPSMTTEAEPCRVAPRLRCRGGVVVGSD